MDPLFYAVQTDDIGGRGGYHGSEFVTSMKTREAAIKEAKALSGERAMQVRAMAVFVDHKETLATFRNGREVSWRA